VELYDTNTDWTQSKDLAKSNPQKLHELQRLWLIKRSSTTCCLWTTALPNAPILTSPAGRS
jgi:hypothetical protein